MNPYITPDDLKEVTEAQDTIDAGLLEPGILKAQRLRIRPVLGKALDARLQAHLITPEDPADPMTKLLEAIKPALAWWGLYHALPRLHYKITNKAIVIKNSDPQSTSVTIDDVKMLRSDISEDGQAAIVDLVEFLTENAEDYPEYTVPNEICTPKTGNEGGIYLD